MATIEKWISRKVRYSQGTDGTRIKTEERFYYIDHADIDSYVPQYQVLDANEETPMYLMDIDIDPHEAGTKATVRLMYSSAGVGVVEYNEFFRSAGTQRRVTRYCGSQHPNVIEIPDAQMVYGYVAWEEKLGDVVVDRVGMINKAAHGPFEEGTLLMLAPDAERVGREKWRVTYQWLYNPGGWTSQCHVANCPNPTVWHYARVDMHDFFFGFTEEEA